MTLVCYHSLLLSLLVLVYRAEDVHITSLARRLIENIAVTGQKLILATTIRGHNSPAERLQCMKEIYGVLEEHHIWG